jgi:hypothetical protein
VVDKAAVDEMTFHPLTLEKLRQGTLTKQTGLLFTLVVQKQGTSSRRSMVLSPFFELVLPGSDFPFS